MILGPPFHRHGKGPAGWSIKGYAGGSVPFRLDRRQFHVDDGAYLVVNAGQDYEFETPADSPLFNFTIFLTAADLRDAWASHVASDEALLDDPGAGHGPECMAIALRIPDRIAGLRSFLRRRWEAGLATAEMIDSAACEIVAAAMSDQAEVLGQARKVRAVRRATREEAVRRIRRAVDYIESTPCAPLNLDALAAVACMSKHHFLRCFKAVTGQTPYRFVLHRRIARAEKLLVKTTRHAADIGRACGFDDPASFSAAFRELKGAPPQAWRTAQLRNFSQSGDSDKL